MLFERVYEEGLSQASYFIGCQAENQAVVVDARRDVQQYLDLAEQHGMEIIAVTETHIHADYLSGTRELAAATGATAYVSGEGGDDWQYGFAAERLHHGDRIEVGNLSLTALHIPGHTPEHLSFALTDHPVTDEPGYLLSGDFVFVGDLGRPDLLDETGAGEHETRFEGARQLFRSLRDVFLALPDYVQVHPAHGSGSPCGKALGAVPSSTVGYEREFAWWAPYLAADDEEGFTRELLEGQPDAHQYFARMKRQNKQGPALLGKLPELHRVPEEKAARHQKEDDALFIDTRSQDAVHQGTVREGLAIPNGDSASTWAAWVIDPETEKRPLIALAPDADQAAAFRDRLIRVGIDTVSGYVTSFDGLETFVPEQIDPEEATEAPQAVLLDVRSASEHEAGSIPGAQHISGGRLMWQTDRLPEDKRLVTFCQSGARNSVLASALRRRGFDVAELRGSYLGWQAAQAGSAR